MMELFAALIYITVIYLWFLFLDRFLKSCSHYGYIQFLKGTGLEIKVFHFKWTTTAFNRMFVNIGSKYPRFLNFWFNLGLVLSLLFLPISISLLFIAFFQNFSPTKNVEGAIIQPALPGVNLPASEIGYYSLTLLLSSLVHEFGHALAAAQEDVNLINVGANVMFVLPVAYVNINSDKLFSLNPWKRLKILCAGVWHNLFISFLAFLCYPALPYVFLPLFNYGSGVIVSKIHQSSPLFGSNGLNFGDVITQINDCEINNEDSWYKCISALSNAKPGFCIEADIVHNLDESIPLKHLDDGSVSCCNLDNRGKLCFEYLDVKDSVLELPPYACLPGRKVTELSKQFCTTTSHICPTGSFCFRPVLANHTNLFKIKRTSQKEVVYLGLGSDLVRTVTVSSYIPKFQFIGTKIPDAITKFLGYIIMFSIGLAVVNILPCLSMDGQHITNTLFHIYLSERVRTTHIKFISAIFTTCFTILLIVHCIIFIYYKVSS